MDDVQPDKVEAFEVGLLKHVRDEFPEILEEMAKSGDLTDALAQRLREVVANFKAGFKG